MPRYIIICGAGTRRGHDYGPMHAQLRKWAAAPLQRSVWLAELDGPATAIRAVLMARARANDAICVIQLPASGFDWTTLNAHKDGVDWLRARSS